MMQHGPLMRRLLATYGKCESCGQNPGTHPVVFDDGQVYLVCEGCLPPEPRKETTMNEDDKALALHELEQLGADVMMAEERLGEAQRLRDRAIVDAAGLGWSQQKVADAAGVSRQRVTQIVADAREQGGVS